MATALLLRQMALSPGYRPRIVLICLSTCHTGLYSLVMSDFFQPDCLPAFFHAGRRCSYGPSTKDAAVPGCLSGLRCTRRREKDHPPSFCLALYRFFHSGAKSNGPCSRSSWSATVSGAAFWLSRGGRCHSCNVQAGTRNLGRQMAMIVPWVLSSDSHPYGTWKMLACKNTLLLVSDCISTAT